MCKFMHICSFTYVNLCKQTTLIDMKFKKLTKRTNPNHVIRVGRPLLEREDPDSSPQATGPTVYTTCHFKKLKASHTLVSICIFVHNAHCTHPLWRRHRRQAYVQTFALPKTLVTTKNPTHLATIPNPYFPPERGKTASTAEEP